MSLKQDFADHIKSQSEIWRAQIKAYQQHLERTGEQARADYKKSVAQMESNAVLSISSTNCDPSPMATMIWTPLGSMLLTPISCFTSSLCTSLKAFCAMGVDSMKL